MTDYDDNNNNETGDGVLLRRKDVIYCGACGMPPEYCEYSPDFETHCSPWLQEHHPLLWGALPFAYQQKQQQIKQKPEQPWTTQERLTAFYEKYVPEKVESVPGLLEKYQGKEEKLFQALVQKYGPEPMDPYFSDSDEEGGGEEEKVGDDDADGGDDTATGKSKSKKRRGASAKAAVGPFTGQVIVQKQAQKKKRFLTVVHGLEPALAVNHHKLKDATKAFAKRFAGSSSVKDGNIIVQGDHVLELAELLVDKFQVPEECVYVDMGLGAVPLRG